MDLMATDVPTQLQTNGTAGVDVLYHNVSNISGWLLSSQPSSVGVVLAHINDKPEP